MAALKATFSAALIVSAIATVSAADQSCIQVTFPNILHFGECLGQPQDMCHNPAEMVTVAEKIILCAVSGISHLDIGSQLFLLEGVITEVFERFGFGSLVDMIFSLCKTVGGGMKMISKIGNSIFGGIFGEIVDTATSMMPLGDCTGLHVAGDIMCGQPVVFQFPSTLNIGKCLNTTMSACVGTHANQALVIQQFFEAVTCVFSGIIVAPGNSMTSVFCTVANVVINILSSGPLKIVGSVMSELENAIGMQC
uniref:24 kDa family member n=1 Tax=Rhipicephalus microplus TaxID=6941 RepID=A0A6M2D509_RHIMP